MAQIEMEYLMGEEKEEIKKHTFKDNIWYIVLIAIIFIVVGILIYNKFQYSEVIVNQVRYYDSMLDASQQRIIQLQKDERDLIFDLYTAVKECCVESESEILKRLWFEKFPIDDVIAEDPDTGLIMIYALLINHPEIRFNVNVAQSLVNIENNHRELSSKIDNYNLLLNFYMAWANEYNESVLCKLIGDGTVDPLKYSIIVFQ